MKLINGIYQPSKPAAARTGYNHAVSRRARTTLDRADQPVFGSPFYIESPPDPLNDWRLSELSESTLDRISTAKLIELLADLSPEVSRALWDFIRFCNPGFTAVALRPNSDEQDDRATAVLSSMLDTLADLHGATNVQINRLFFSIFIRGAMLTELVLDENGREFVDLAIPDPYGIRFKKYQDPVRGDAWEMGQYQMGEWVSFDGIETIRYVPLDPLPGVPYGRQIVAPAVFTSLFLIGLLYDLRRVVAQQGYPRMDISVDLERLSTAMPPDLVSDPNAAKKWIDEVINEVCRVYGSLEPDDAYVHTDVVQVNGGKGTLGIGGGGMQFIGNIISTLERMTTRALKTMPLLMGYQEGTTETLANRQWEVHVAGIKSIQHLAENTLERMFTLALRAQGINANVQWRFAELRASEMLRDAQVEAMNISNAKSKYDQGWISQDTASEDVTGTPADQETPRVQSNGGDSDFSTNISEESDSRRLADEIRDTKQLIAGAIIGDYHVNGNGTKPIAK